MVIVPGLYRRRGKHPFRREEAEVGAAVPVRVSWLHEDGPGLMKSFVILRILDSKMNRYSQTAGFFPGGGIGDRHADQPGAVAGPPLPPHFEVVLYPGKEVAAVLLEGRAQFPKQPWGAVEAVRQHQGVTGDGGDEIAGEGEFAVVLPAQGDGEGVLTWEVLVEAAKRFPKINEGFRPKNTHLERKGFSESRNRVGTFKLSMPNSSRKRSPKSYAMEQVRKYFLNRV